MEHHGTRYADRWKVLGERVLAMRQIWTEQEAEFHAEFVEFEKLCAYPKPRPAAGPPVLLGVFSKYVYKPIAEYCDGGFPIYQDPASNKANGLVNYADIIAKPR